MKMKLRGKQWQESSNLVDLQPWTSSSTFPQSQSSFSFWSFTALLYSDLLVCSFGIFMCSFHLCCLDSYSTLSNLLQFRAVFMPYWGWLWLHVKATNLGLALLNLSPGSTSLKLKFQNSVELVLFVLSLHTLFLSHTMALSSHTAGLDPDLTCHPWAVQSFPILSSCKSKTNSHFFNLPLTGMENNARRCCQLSSHSFYWL